MTPVLAQNAMASYKKLPLTSMQSQLLPMLLDPKCTRTFKHIMMITEGVRVKPGISSRRVERALKRLVRRHDILRLQFIETDNDWHASIQDEEAVRLKVEDYGEVPETEMRAICADIVEQTMEVSSNCLCDFRQLRFGSLGDVIFMRVHHTITDAYGVLVLAEDFIKLVLNLPISGRGLSHVDYIKNIEAKQPEYGGKLRDYWQNLLLPPPAPIPFSRFQDKSLLRSNPQYIEDVMNYEIPMSTKEYENIRKIASQNGGTFFTFITATVAQVIRDMTGIEDIIGRTFLSRTSGPLSQYAGCVARFPLFRTRISDGQTIAERARVLNEQIVTSSQFIARDFAKSENSLDAELLKNSDFRPQIFVHVAAADGRAQASMFESLFRANGGKIMRLGPVEIERMSFPRQPAIGVPTEMAVYVFPDESGIRIHLRANKEIVDAQQLKDLAQKTDDTLRKLQP